MTTGNRTGGQAAINLPENATLILRGEGTVTVTGGNGANAKQGGDAYRSGGSAVDYARAASGGNGGNGAGGGGAAIGTDGRNGGAGGEYGKGGYKSKDDTGIQAGRNGCDGGDGAASSKAGNLIVLDSVSVIATAGTGGSAAGPGDPLAGRKKGKIE